MGRSADVLKVNSAHGADAANRSLKLCGRRQVVAQLEVDLFSASKVTVRIPSDDAR
jgi:hypothetical protein